jgi:homoserine kinase type II
MAQYTKLSRRDIQEISGKYELKVIDSEPINQGVGNTNYLIRTKGGKYILTIFEIEPIQVVHLSKILCLLEEHKYPAPRIKTTFSGEAITKYKEKAVLIKPYIEGKVEKNLHESGIEQVGTALANLHEIPAPDYLPDQHTYVVKNYPKVIEQELDWNYKEWVKERYGIFLKNMPSRLPIGLVHGDLFYDNILFDGEKLKGILDFESVCRVHKIFDLGMTTVGICTEDTEVKVEKVRALVKGYQEVRLLENREKDSLQMFIECAAILTSTWRFWKYKMDDPGIENPRKHMQMVKIARNVSAIRSEVFMKAVFS